MTKSEEKTCLGHVKALRESLRWFYKRGVTVAVTPSLKGFEITMKAAQPNPRSKRKEAA